MYCKFSWNRWSVQTKHCEARTRTEKYNEQAQETKEAEKAKEQETNQEAEAYNNNSRSTTRCRKLNSLTNKIE